MIVRPKVGYASNACLRPKACSSSDFASSVSFTALSGASLSSSKEDEMLIL